jgi:hypothetical protein
LAGLSRAALDGLAKKYAVSAVAVTAPAHTLPLKKARIGLYRPWAPSIDEGWTRWVLENYGFEPKSLYNADIRSANLKSRYDVIVLPDMSTRQMMVQGLRAGHCAGAVCGRRGRGRARSSARVCARRGTLIAFNRTASTLIPLMSLPVQNVIEGAKSDKFFCSGALLRVETEHRGAAGELWRFGVAGGDVPGRAGVPDAAGISWGGAGAVSEADQSAGERACCCIRRRLKARCGGGACLRTRAHCAVTDSSRSSAGSRTRRTNICSTSFTV